MNALTGPRTSAALLAGIALTVTLGVASLAIGSRPVPPTDVVRALFDPSGTSPEAIIVWQLRMPRTLVAVLVGAALAVAGAVMQAVTRNPLAEPGLLGINAGASLAVVCAIAFLGVTTIGGYVWFAFVGAAVAALVVYVLGTRRAIPGQHARLVLAGLALSASLHACTGIVTMRDTDTFDSYRFWVVGSLADRPAATVAAVAPFLVAGLVLALLLGPSLNALALGEDAGAALGVPVTAVRAAAIAAITLLCGASTAVAGPLAFLGLVVPHVVRFLTGPDHRRILAASLAFGPALLLAADVIGRTIARPGEIEAGIVTAFVGAPVLLALVLRVGRA